MSNKSVTARKIAVLCAASIAFAVGAGPATIAATAPLGASAGSSLGRPFSAPSATRTAEIAADYGSIFSGQIEEAVDSGWAACPTPIVWDADLSELTAVEAAREVANLQWAFDQWGQVSGLSFTYGGPVSLSFHSSDFTLTPTDGSTPAARQIYLDYMRSKETPMLGGDTVGLGSPSSVMMSTREIQSGTAVFRTEHIETVGAKDPKAVRSLYLHELGHVLGLSHAALTANVMYPVVTDHTTLGAGDVHGVQVMTKPCATPAPAAPTPPAPASSDPTSGDPAPSTPLAPAAPAPTDPASAPTDPSVTTPPAVAPETPAM